MHLANCSGNFKANKVFPKRFGLIDDFYFVFTIILLSFGLLSLDFLFHEVPLKSVCFFFAKSGDPDQNGLINSPGNSHIPASFTLGTSLHCVLAYNS